MLHSLPSTVVVHVLTSSFLTVLVEPLLSELPDPWARAGAAMASRLAKPQAVDGLLMAVLLALMIKAARILCRSGAYLQSVFDWPTGGFPGQNARQIPLRPGPHAALQDES